MDARNVSGCLSLPEVLAYLCACALCCWRKLELRRAVLLNAAPKGSGEGAAPLPLWTKGGRRLPSSSYRIGLEVRREPDALADAGPVLPAEGDGAPPAPAPPTMEAYPGGG